MGYMGLECVCDSDAASDLSHFVFLGMIKTLRKGLKEKGNSFNTSGPVNVALFIEENLKPSKFIYDHEMAKLAQDTKAKLEIQIKYSKDSEWDCEDNKKYHLKAYARLIKSLNKFLPKT